MAPTTPTADTADVPDDLTGALIAFQAALPTVPKAAQVNAGARRYRYADLADVSGVVLPRLAAVGLAYTCRTEPTESGGLALRCELRHRSGETVSFLWPLPDAAEGNYAQALGSWLTYGRRYALLALCGVAPEDEDDDGQAAAAVAQRRGGHLAASTPDPIMATVRRWRESGWSDTDAAAHIARTYDGAELADLTDFQRREVWKFFRDNAAPAGSATVDGGPDGSGRPPPESTADSGGWPPVGAQTEALS